jgi:hypothetical protein
MKFFKQIDIFYIVTFLFLLVSSNANILASNDIIWFVIMLFMFTVAVAKKLLTVPDARAFGIFALVYFVFYSIRDTVFNGLDAQYVISDTLFLFKYIFLSFLLCKILKDRMAYYIVKVVVHLTIVSFFFYSLQLLGFGDDIFRLSRSLALHSKSDFEDYSNFILFTYVRGSHAYRNSGFAWEPGAFGCFLIVTLILNLFLNKFKFDKRSVILIIAILTTLSTTNYLSLLVLMFCVYRIKVPKLNVGAILIAVTSVVLIMYLPVLGDKINNTYKSDMSDLNKLNKLAVLYRHTNAQIPLNRFSSMAFLWDTFGIKLLWGISNKYDAVANKIYDINISNGVFDLFARFGVIGYIYLMYRYSKLCLEYISKVEYLVYFILIFTILGFGEPVLALPFFLTFLFIDVKQLNLFQQKVRRVRFADLDLPPPNRNREPRAQA